MTDQPIKPVAEYLVNGPIPVPDLMDIDFLDVYLGSVVASRLDIRSMLEHVCVHGAPGWWQGTVPEFEQAFHEQYQQEILNHQQLGSDAARQAAYKEVQAGRIASLPEEATEEQVEAFLAQGRKRRNQVQAVETLMEMWVDDQESDT